MATQSGQATPAEFTELNVDYNHSTDLFKGERLLLFVDGRPIAYCKKHDFEFSADQVDVTTKNDGGFERKMGGTVNWSINVDGLSSMGAGQLSQELLMHYAASGKPLSFEICELKRKDLDNGRHRLLKGNVSRKGQVVITSVKESSAVGEYQTYSATLQGSGELKDKYDRPYGSAETIEALQRG